MSSILQAVPRFLRGTAFFFLWTVFFLPVITASAPSVSTGAGAAPAQDTQTGIGVALDAGTQGPLRGSVIAAQVRGSQQQTVAGLQAQFATIAAARPQPTGTITLSPTSDVGPVQKDGGFGSVTASGAVRAPGNQLFRAGTKPGGPLFETDPAFTNYRTWASSSYMLGQLAMDPERTMKIYGDGFAQQRSVDDQILALTGRKYLSGYGATGDEYQALLDSGVLYAQQYHLTPGVALSAEQMASLTTDMVWLEAKTVTAPDGTTTQALVPTVYLRHPQAGDLTPTGALISGSNEPPALRSRRNLKPEWTIGQLVLLKAHLPDAGCRCLASTFNRVFAHRSIWVSKTRALVRHAQG